MKAQKIFKVFRPRCCLFQSSYKWRLWWTALWWGTEKDIKRRQQCCQTLEGPTPTTKLSQTPSFQIADQHTGLESLQYHTWPQKKCVWHAEHGEMASAGTPAVYTVKPLLPHLNLTASTSDLLGSTSNWCTLCSKPSRRLQSIDSLTCMPSSHTNHILQNLPISTDADYYTGMNPMGVQQQNGYYSESLWDQLIHLGTRHLMVWKHVLKRRFLAVHDKASTDTRSGPFFTKYTVA